SEEVRKKQNYDEKATNEMEVSGKKVVVSSAGDNGGRREGTGGKRGLCGGS
ncbi:hypothetical protein Tco_0515807, partial [Tanacetum coccineum]